MMKADSIVRPFLFGVTEQSACNEKAGGEQMKINLRSRPLLLRPWCVKSEWAVGKKHRHKLGYVISSWAGLHSTWCLISVLVCLVPEHFGV